MIELDRAYANASVVDASVWVSRLVSKDVHHLASQQWLERETSACSLFVCPTIALAEIAGAIARRLDDSRIGRAAVKALLAIPGFRLVSVDKRLGERAYQLAADRRLRGADAVYVAVAQDLQIPLVSWDREQLERTTAIINAHTPILRA